MKIKLIAPSIHLNGTSKEALCEALQNAGDAISAARHALVATAPNARDYYVQADPRAYQKACCQFSNQDMALEDIENQLAAVWLAIESDRIETEEDLWPRLEVTE